MGARLRSSEVWRDTSCSPCIVLSQEKETMGVNLMLQAPFIKALEKVFPRELLKNLEDPTHRQ